MDTKALNKEILNSIIEHVGGKYDGIKYFASIFKYKDKRFMVKTASSKKIDDRNAFYFVFSTKNTGKLDFYILCLKHENSDLFLLIPKRVIGKKQIMKIIEIDGWHRFLKYQHTIDNLKSAIDELL